MAELSLWLDSYDDIYSDFDSRKYHKRRLSEDFVDELKSSLEYSTGPIHKLLLLLPPEQRKYDIEKEIVASLKDHFHHHFTIFKTKEKKILRKGLTLLISGVLVMSVYALFTFKGDSSYTVTVLRLLIEPASWFMVWTGLDALFYDYKEAKHETSFYKILEQLEIYFNDL